MVGIIGDIAQTELNLQNELWLEGENQNIYIPLRTYQKQRGDLFVERNEGTMRAEQD